ncbi:hypothetical protein K1T71_000062 [Dendrolimus kikuchii]|uniref:Uncharacterized protein n=1 Tax=Dendrolimus kikuchii TaxID=765133 RepID=A0ACC1DIU0_9NEOP|nr:hypothetical protein K1T71_000062 [Dendrolimus kikuchii]
MSSNICCWTDLDTAKLSMIWSPEHENMNTTKPVLATMLGGKDTELYLRHMARELQSTPRSEIKQDPDQAEDEEESYEENVHYNSTKLQRILEDLDEPELRSTDAIRASPQPSTSSDDQGLQSIETLRSLESLQPSTYSADLPSSTYPGIGQPTLPARGRGNGRETGRGSGRGLGRGSGLGTGSVIGRKRIAEESPEHRDSDSISDNESLESELEPATATSDEDEDMWKKNLWTDNRPAPDTFDSVPMTPTRILPSNARPIRHFEKFFTLEVFELIVTETESKFRSGVDRY